MVRAGTIYGLNARSEDRVYLFILLFVYLSLILIYIIKNNKMVRRHINRVKRTYARARGIGSNILQNPIMIGVITGAAKNMINGQPPVDISSIQRRITQPNAKNPLIYLLLGHFLHSKPLMTIGAFQIIDPPVSEDADDMPDEEIEALSEEIGEDEDEEQKICIH